jgi:AcrR family transcriptional regulator
MATDSRSAAPGRERILDAAYELFLEREYPHVTLREIAEAANVAPQTVYYFFGSKPVLGAATQSRSIGDGRPVGSWREAPWAPPLVAATSAQELMQTFVRADTSIKRRIAAWQVAVGRHLPPEGRQMTPGRDEFFGYLLDRLAQFGELRSDCSRGQLVTTLALINSLSAYLEATRAHGWTDDEWRSWLEDVLIRTLLSG